MSVRKQANLKSAYVSSVYQNKKIKEIEKYVNFATRNGKIVNLNNDTLSYYYDLSWLPAKVCIASNDNVEKIVME